MPNEENKETLGVNLSNDFQQELKNKKRKVNWLGVVSATSLAVIVIVVLGLGSYEIFFKKESIKQDADTKIESKPVATDEKASSEPETEEKTTATTPAPTPAPAPTAPSTTQEYVIADGDNLGAIAVKFETTVEKLKAANNIQDETLLQIGQKIKIVK